ncbi:hypothetical protein DFH28DRAFT_923804 [Melampsora americana]|nr:hypothetical protein DFH28DRAFT_936391 [Melampsora americana]KAH9820516.1 hypothetical protein DFH28DRAFT_923804 [Melampsora americana]
MFSFINFAFLFILLVSICNGTPTMKFDDLEKRDVNSMIARSNSFPGIAIAKDQAHQKRTLGGAGGAGGMGGGGLPGAGGGLPGMGGGGLPGAGGGKPPGGGGGGGH